MLIIRDSLRTLCHIYTIGDDPRVWERPFKFYAVAQTFTQHLHHAEYLRRIKQVKLENANAIDDIARPTDGKVIMQKEKQRQKESEVLSAQQRAGLSNKGQRTTSRVRRRSDCLPDYR